MIRDNAMRVSIAIFILFPLFGYSQKQGNIWYFGNHAGLDFSSGIPVTLNNGQTDSACNGASEGSSVICDSSGALLFYCNGRQIWNKNQQVMPNGDSLLSNPSSTQGSIIIPQPGSSRFFYVFTVDDFDCDALQYGFRYSIVDICLDNGNGDVIAGQKNILLLNTVTEKLTAVRDSNGVDYWVIVHKYFSDAFYAYRLTAAGIVDTVISHVGSFHPADSIGVAEAIGQLKASPNGKKLALVNGNSSNSIAEYFDFNKTTGIVSNWVNIQTNPAYNYYGVSFSPDNSKLYIAGDLNDYGIYQFNLNAGGGNPDSVKASRTEITGIFSNYFGLQLANNGKIYSAHANTYLSVINYPNSLGISCGYVADYINLNGHSANYGLPNFVDSYDYSNSIYSCSVAPPIASFQSSDTVICANDCVNYTDLSTNATSWQWSFIGATDSTSTVQSPQNICYPASGTYNVTLIASNSGGSDSITFTNYISVIPAPPTPVITQHHDTLYCTTNPSYISYQWYIDSTIITTATDTFLVVSKSGNYNVQVTNANGCKTATGINITIGIQNYASDNIISIFPNPANNQLTIHILTSTNWRSVVVSIMNVLGQEVSTQTLQKREDDIIIYIGNLSADIYFVQLTSVKGKWVQKFVKQ